MDFIENDPSWPYSRAKTAVIRAAVSVIREGGPRAATLKNIAQRAGITEPAIFRHFDGVDGLFEGLFFVFETAMTAMTACFNCEGRGCAKLIKGSSGAMDILAQNKDLSYLILHAEHIFRSYEDYKRRLVALRKADANGAMQCLLEAEEDGELRAGVAPRVAALAIMGVMHYTFHHWIETDSEIEFGVDVAALGKQKLVDLVALFREPIPPNVGLREVIGST